MTLNVYLAADYARRKEILSYSLQDNFLELGMQTTSRWLTNPPAFNDGGIGSGSPIATGFALEAVKCDLADIEAADVFVQFTTGEKARGGRHVELGYAIASKLPIIVIGPIEHVFHYHPSVVVVGHWSAAITTLCHYL